MWMVQIDGAWQPADSDEVVLEWLRTGVAGAETEIRHSSWAHPRKLREVPPFSVAVSRRGGAPVPPPPGMVSPPQYRPDPDAAHTTAKGLAIFVAVCVGLYVLYRLALASTALSVLITLTPWVAVGVALFGRWKKDSPPLIRRVSGVLLRRPGLFVFSMLLVFMAGLSGVAERDIRAEECEADLAKVKERERAKASATMPASFYTDAIRSCAHAGEDDVVAELRGKQTAAEKKLAAEERARQETEKRRLEEERKQNYTRHLELARKAASDEDDATALANFKEAEKFGAIAASDSAAYSRLLFDQGKRQLKDGAYEAALADLRKAQAVSSELEGVESYIERAEKGLRDARVKAWIAEADAVARDKEKCNTGDELKRVWKGLQQVSKDDSRYRRARSAAKRLERCRKRIARDIEQGTNELAKAMRKNWADEYEVGLLDEGLDVRVSTRGRYLDRVTIKYVLFNRAWAHKITNGGSMSEGAFLRNLQDLGFAKVTFSDGYSESYSYDLDPPNVKGLTAKNMAKSGLGTPFEL